MKSIISISLFAQLLDNDLLPKSKEAGIILLYPDLYKGSRLSTKFLQRLQHLQKQDSLVEIAFSEQEMLYYHNAFNRCKQQRHLTFEEFVAVAYAKAEGCLLLAEAGWLSRYAKNNGVTVMSFKELELYCEQQRRRDRRRKERLRTHFSGPANENSQEEEPMQQAIDDDTIDR
jgi:hypothetical protein